MTCATPVSVLSAGGHGKPDHTPNAGGLFGTFPCSGGTELERGMLLDVVVLDRGDNKDNNKWWLEKQIWELGGGTSAVSWGGCCCMHGACSMVQVALCMWP